MIIVFVNSQYKTERISIISDEATYLLKLQNKGKSHEMV